MNINDKSRIRWACRRGMLELDITIMAFFHHDYDLLNNSDKSAFVRLLKSDDPDLFNWMMNYGKPADPRLQRIIEIIQIRNRQRGAVAI